MNYPGEGWRYKGRAEAAGIAERALKSKVREPAVGPGTPDKGVEMVPTPWQDLLNSAPISDSILRVLLCTYHVPTSAGLPSLSHVLCPPES